MYYGCPNENRRGQQDDRRGPQVTVASNTGISGPLPVITTLLADPINVVSTNIETAGRDVTNLLIFTSTISLPLGISVT